MADKGHDVISKPDSLESGFFIELSTENPPHSCFFPTRIQKKVKIYSCKESEKLNIHKDPRWLKIKKRFISTDKGNYPLTVREGELLLAFLKQEKMFLHSKEIKEYLAVKDEKSLISRLRIKLRRVTADFPGFCINIVPIKGQGYYLSLVVDNLWKTE